MDLLSAPYRDRQLITIVERTENSMEPVEIKLGDYVGLKKQTEAWAALRNPRTYFSKRYWTDSKNWGLYGYAFDKLRGGGPSSSEPTRYLQKIPAEIADSVLQFPPGHPLYNTVYAGHPLKAPVYVPVAYFHRFLFQEKCNELLTLLYSLGALEVAIHYLRGYSDSFSAKGGLSVPAEIPVEAGASFSRKASNRSEGTLHAYFKPAGMPHIPESTVWYQHEATWMKIAQARLTAGLQDIDVELRYDDDFGVSAEVALKLSEFGFKLGGEFSKHEQTAWEFHASFRK